MLKIGQNHCLLEFTDKSIMPLELIWVEKGVYSIGLDSDAPSSDREKLFHVTLSNGFWLGKFQVTEKHWEEIFGEKSMQDNMPKLDVSWFKAKEYCRLLNSRFKNLLPNGYRFDLPTEVQWEIAAKSGGLDDIFVLPKEDDIMNVGWYKENSGGEPHPVGLKNANSWGFFDVVGNGFEWCSNSFQKYPSTPVVDWPIHCEENDQIELKVLRSSSAKGTFKDPSFRITYRAYFTPSKIAGLRVCLRK